MNALQAILTADAVRLGCTAAGKDDAVRQAGAVLVEIGAVEPNYVDAMLAREASVSTYLGEGVAIPHGTDDSRGLVKRTALAVLQFPDGVDWNGNQVSIAVAIASATNEHVGVLQSLAMVLSDSDKARRLRETTDANEVLELLTPCGDEDDADDDD